MARVVLVAVSVSKALAGVITEWALSGDPALCLESIRLVFAERVTLNILMTKAHRYGAMATCLETDLSLFTQTSAFPSRTPEKSKQHSF